MKREAYYRAPGDVAIWYGMDPRPDRPWLVLSDGIACDGFIWPHLLDYFSKDWSILRWHYRGHGRSEAPRDEAGLTLETLAQDLVGILAEAGVERPVLVGHSMGVQIALETYRLLRLRARALVLLCGSYGKILSTFKGSDRGESILPHLRAAALKAPRLVSAVISRVVPTALSFAVAQRTEIHPTLARQADFFPYLEHVARMDPQVFLAMLSHAAAHTAEDLLPEVGVPTLVVAGDRDGFTPAAQSRAMAERIPGAALLALPEGTHTAPIEFPREICARMDAFLAAVPP